MKLGKGEYLRRKMEGTQSQRTTQEQNMDRLRELEGALA